MKTKDLFAGCCGTVMPHDDRWGVSLNTLDLSTIFILSSVDLPAALEAVRHWMLMLDDETQIDAEDVTSVVLDRLRETMARLAVGEEARLPEPVKEDEMRTWFDREMEKSWHEGE
jgi:hypothetical protein